jgi:hypothetical protein
MPTGRYQRRDGKAGSVSERLAPAVEREEFTDAVRRGALARAAGHCEGCGRSLDGVRYVFDHTIPFRRSRDSTLANCKVLCSDGRNSCDGRKTFDEDLPGIAAVKRYGKNRLPLDIERPEKKAEPKMRGRGFQPGHRPMTGKPFPKRQK